VGDYKPPLWWGRTKLGPGRAYWVVFSPGSDGETIHGEGYEADTAAAERAARAVVNRVNDRHRGRYEVFWQGKAGFATWRHKKKVAEERRRRGANFGGARIQDYLYTHHEPDRGADCGPKPCWKAHLILKETPQRVWVHPDGCPVEDLGTERERFRSLGDDSAIDLDRRKLERKGCVSSRRGHHSFYLLPEGGGPAHATAASAMTLQALQLLGLGWPCNAEDLKAAYRRRSKEAHPDVGGSPEEFRRVREAYEHAARFI
jgi:hypothetical protein